MSENRIEKVNSLLEQEVGKILQRGGFLPADALVTVTRVEASGNLIEAKVYISVYPEEKFDGVLSMLKREVFSIQQDVNKKLKMRPVPKIIFVKDEIISKAANIERALHQLKKEEKGD